MIHSFGLFFLIQALKQLYVLVLGLDVLGNPFALLTGLKEGARDFFYEPYQVSLMDDFKRQMIIEFNSESQRETKMLDYSLAFVIIIVVIITPS